MLKRNAQNVFSIGYFSLSFEVGVHVTYYAYVLTFLSSTFC
jgi:hypothetical protein